MVEILPEAHPLSAEGDAIGVLVLHGFTGNPSSMRPIAEAMAADGRSVEMPRLPGHGTTVEDMATTGWADWTGEVEAAYQRLAARTQQIVVCGLSMGGALTAWVGAEHPDVSGLVFINSAAQPSQELRDMMQQMLDAGTEFMDGPGNDVADPEVTESAYAQMPVAALISMLDGVIELAPRLASITTPALIMNSPQDHVVPPDASDHLASVLGGDVRRVSLDRSFHVAPIDLDGQLIIDEIRAFVAEVTG